MSETKNSVPPSMKLGKKWGYIVAGILAVLLPAWTGAVNSLDSGVVADQAAVKAFEAGEKAEFGYKLLAQKVMLESTNRDKEIDRLEKRLDKIDVKMDALLMRARRYNPDRDWKDKTIGQTVGEPTNGEQVPNTKEITLPKNLDLAYRSQKVVNK